MSIMIRSDSNPDRREEVSLQNEGPLRESAREKLDSAGSGRTPLVEGAMHRRPYRRTRKAKRKRSEMRQPN